MGVFGAVAVVLTHIVALKARHPFLQPVDASLDALIFTLVLIGHAGAVAGHTGVFDGSDFLQLMVRDQTAESEIRSADVALATGSVAGVAVVVKRLFHVGVAEIGPTGSQYGSIASEILVQAGGNQSGGLGVANATDPLGVFYGITYPTFMGCVFVVYPFDTTMAADAVLGVMNRRQELAANEHLLPCLQRRQFARSALAGGFLRLYLLLYS